MKEYLFKITETENLKNIINSLGCLYENSKNQKENNTGKIGSSIKSNR